MTPNVFWPLMLVGAILVLLGLALLGAREVRRFDWEVVQNRSGWGFVIMGCGWMFLVLLMVVISGAAQAFWRALVG